jgi:4-hydroxythreonine-4-phosphate dehydrogenase
MTLPLALSCGDPSGIGPELAQKARAALGADMPFFWIGDPAHLPKSARWQAIDSPQDACLVEADVLPVLAHIFPAPVVHGAPDPANAPAIISAIKRGVDLVQSGAALALCTLPINKKALKDGASFAFPGHTEYLAHLAGGARAVMMLAAPELRVVPVTIHIPLSEVPRALTAKALRETIIITHNALIRDFAIAAPRVAVAGLNPHAGEGGAMGHEDSELIMPVLNDLRAKGMDIAGPLPADTMFHSRARAAYDVAICMYHDQALIPIKTIDFDGGVNVTLGLPFVRTSPDHGTAYDIAGRGIAQAGSVIAALRMAQDLAQRRNDAMRGPNGHD